MKYYFTIAVLAISTFAFTSCQRSHTCTCYSPSLNRSTPDFEITGSKKDAQNECESQPQLGKYTGTDYQCRLK